MTHLLKQTRFQVATTTRREQNAKDRRRRVGLRILAIATEATAALEAYMRSGLAEASEIVVESECEAITKEFLDMSPAEINSFTDHAGAARSPELQQAIDWTIKSELHAWTSFQNLTKGVAPTAGAMMRQRQEVQGSILRALKVHHPRSTQRSAKYKWLSTWRRKWVMPSGRFSHRDTPSVEVMRAKAGIGGFAI